MPCHSAASTYLPARLSAPTCSGSTGLPTCSASTCLPAGSASTCQPAGHSCSGSGCYAWYSGRCRSECGGAHHLRYCIDCPFCFGCPDQKVLSPFPFPFFPFLPPPLPPQLSRTLFPSSLMSHPLPSCLTTLSWLISRSLPSRLPFSSLPPCPLTKVLPLLSTTILLCSKKRHFLILILNL